jgi:hypothetical protein
MGRWLCRGGDAFFPGGFETTKAWVLCFSFLDLDHLAMVFGIIGFVERLLPWRIESSSMGLSDCMISTVRERL